MKSADAPLKPYIVGVIAILFGLVVALWPAPGYAPNLLQIRAAVACSLAAAGLFLMLQVGLVKDNVPTAIGAINALSLMLSTSTRHLPLGVKELYLSLDQAPGWDAILLEAQHVRFYGPEGAALLEHVVYAASNRTASRPIKASLYLPRDPEPTVRSVAPNWNARSQRWTEALARAETLKNGGLLELSITHIEKSPTISALQVDDRYYQVTMLFPDVPEMRRPTLVMQPDVGDEYFNALWRFAKPV